MSGQSGKPTWRTSSYSGGSGNCVEVAVDRSVGVRDSKAPDGPVLAVGRPAWREFTIRVKNDGAGFPR
jgi:hypothetical protein